MHIAFVTETWPPQVNGVALTVRALALGLAARGHRVEVVRPGRNGNDGKVELLPARGTPLPRYPGLQVGMPQGGEFRRRWREERPDVAYVATEGLLGISAMRGERLADPGRDRLPIAYAQAASVPCTSGRDRPRRGAG